MVLLQISEDKLKIRRSPNYPLPVWNDERRKELMSRTLYMKGFPVENTTLDMLLDFFASSCLIENLQVCLNIPTKFSELRKVTTF